MPKTFVAQNIVRINPVHFEVQEGVVTELVCNAEVNYGEMGLTHQFKLWGLLNTTQKQRAQKLYDHCLAKITNLVLD